jgi:hypothetical protein
LERVEGEALWLVSPDLADGFVGCEASQDLEPLGKVIGCHEVNEMRAQLVMRGVVEALDRGVLDAAVHVLDLWRLASALRPS